MPLSNAQVRDPNNADSLLQRLTQLMEGPFTVVASARAARGAAAVVAIWTPAAGKRVRVKKVAYTTLAATIITVKVGAVLICEFDAPAGSGSFDIPGSGYEGIADAAVTFASSAATTVGYTVVGVEETP